MCMEIRVTESVNRIRAYAQEMGWPNYRLAKEAGLVHTVLREFDSENWNPTKKTLERLESIIPAGFKAGKKRSAKKEI